MIKVDQLHSSWLFDADKAISNILSISILTTHRFQQNVLQNEWSVTKLASGQFAEPTTKLIPPDAIYFVFSAQGIMSVLNTEVLVKVRFSFSII